MKYQSLKDKLSSISKSFRFKNEKTQAPKSEELIQKRMNLKKIGEELKDEFAGLNDQIDKIIEVIMPWYVFPEAQTKPIVISLWGMTGVGKTSFVESLSKKLDLNDKFVACDVSGYVDAEGVALRLPQQIFQIANKQSIILFDEIHNARTLDQFGYLKPKGALQEIWAIADTGKIPKNYSQVESYLNLLLTEKNTLTNHYKHIDFDNKEAVTKEYHSSFYDQYTLNQLIQDLELNIEAQALKSLVTEHVPTFLDWAIEEYRWVLKNAMKMDYSKSLVFFSGNLDEAFTFSFLTNPDDINAEELHEKTRIIDKEKVKSHLFSLFRPEQISRLGNVMLVFPSLSPVSFKKIIKKELKALSEWSRLKCGLQIDFEDAVCEIAFKEGVIAVQGARSVISFVKEGVTPHLTNWIIESLEKEISSIRVDFNFNEQTFDVYGVDGQKLIMKSKIERKIETLPEVKISEEFRKTLAIHEAGHTVVGIVNQGRLPVKVISGALSWFRGGPRVVFKDFESLNLQIAKEHIQTLLAGAIAEKLYLGENLQSSGCSDDLRKATELAASFIQTNGMGEHIGVSQMMITPYAVKSFNKRDDVKVEEWLSEASAEAERIILEQSKLLEAIANELMKSERLTPGDLGSLVKENFIGSENEKMRILESSDLKVYESFPKVISLKKSL